MRFWPSDLMGGNEFTLAKRDPNGVPTLKVTTWSNLLEPGGSVCVEAESTTHRDDGPDVKVRVTLASIPIASSRSVAAERTHLQALIDIWNEDPAGNWQRLISSSRAKVTAYEQKRAQQAAEKLARIESGDWS